VQNGQPAAVRGFATGANRDSGAGQDQGGPIAVKAPQAQAAPASARRGARTGHPPTAPFDFPGPPLSSTAAERGGSAPARRFDFLGVEAFASQLSKSPTHDSRPPELAADPDLDPSAALLLRVGPAASELHLDRIGHNGQEQVAQGPPAHLEGLLRLRAAALSVEGTSQLSSTKASAGDPRPPALASDLRLSADRFSAREAETESRTAPSPGEGKTQCNHHRRGN
jgi:hypothetical protein